MFSSNRSLLSGISPNCQHLLGGELRALVRLALAGTMTSSDHHVVCVVDRSANLKVGFLDAPSVVALVSDKHTPGDWAVSQFVSNAMCSRRGICYGNAKDAIAFCVQTPLPVSASVGVRFTNKLGKPLDHFRVIFTH